MVGLSQLLLKSGTASTFIEDYAACLEMRSEECQIIEDSSTDPGVLIMQVSIFCLFLWKLYWKYQSVVHIIQVVNCTKI